MTIAVRHVKLARRRIPDDRIQPVDDAQLTAGMLASRDELERWSNSDKTADRSENCQNNERHPHRRRRLMRHVRAVSVPAMTPMTARRNVMGDVFVHWPNVLAHVVSRSISGC